MKLTENIYLIGGGPFGLSHEFDSSIYLVDCGSEFVLVDTGAGIDTYRIIDNIKKDGLNPEKISYIFLTHSHADHSSGAAELQKKLGAEVCISEIEADLLNSDDEKKLQLDVAKRSGLYSPDYTFKPCKASKLLKHNDLIKVGKFTFKSIVVPGHSKGSICYYVELSEGKTLFTGDVVFFDGVIGLLNCEGSSLSDYREYINRIEDLNIKILLPGHFVFSLSNGDRHIKKAINSLRLLSIPKNFI